MKYQTIHIEGAILSADILDKIENNTIAGQKPADFATKNNVKDDIAAAWADAQSYWSIYQRRIERLNINQSGVTETRNHWIVPLLGLLGYNLEVQQKGEIVNGKNYTISHRDIKEGDREWGVGSRGREEKSSSFIPHIPHPTPNSPSEALFPIHIMGCNDELDRRRQNSGPRMSPHGLLQEYLNLTEHLYGIVTNGFRLRLLRDSSRLIKLSYIEFDLEQMMQENHYADFAIMYRLLHASRMPADMDSASESLIELFHQESLDSGSRIRDGLSTAVEDSILLFANGFLNNPANEELRKLARKSKENEGEFEQEFYQSQLHLIYRLLFLMVIEERNLVYPQNEDQWKKIQEKQYAHIPKLDLNKARKIYYDYYSVARLRKLAGKRHLADSKHNDYWIALKNTFRLFENKDYGMPLGIQPLSGDIFSHNAVGIINDCQLDNKVIIECLTKLSIFEHPDTHQKIRVNYAALNVEEFGSVYEGLLEYDPVIEEGSRVKEGSRRWGVGSGGEQEGNRELGVGSGVEEEGNRQEEQEGSRVWGVGSRE